MADYTTFRVLLDEPAKKPALGFDVYARAFAEIIEHSDAQFAIGIFGEWGSGKTTLMRSIKSELQAKTDKIVTVWFNAWRYEREPHLIVPILDTVREALVQWAGDRGASSEPSGSTGKTRWPWSRRRNVDPAPARTPERLARTAAGAIGRAAKALLAGASLSGKLAGVGLSLDGDKILAELREPAEPAADKPQSFFHAGFRAMKEAVANFAVDDPASGSVNRRIVIFVDDLDRCLPSNALQVLESMKVMFDLPGIVFVAGLAQSVIDQAVGLKYKEIDRDGGGELVHGFDYSKKLFQVPFGLPRIQTGQLPEYFDSLVKTPGLPADQVQDLMLVVQPHVIYLSGDDSVNPREVKRFINAYTLQVKMLDQKLGPGQLAPHAVLALQAMSFRAEWNGLYELLKQDPSQFREAIGEAMRDLDPGGLWIGAEKEPLPASFLRYVGDVGSGLLQVPDLGPYVTSTEFTRSTDPSVSEALSGLRQVRRVVGELGGSEELDSEMAARFQKAVQQFTGRSLSGEGRLVQGFHQCSEDLRRLAAELTPDGWAERRDQWLKEVAAPVAEISQILTELRRRTVIGTAS